MDDLHGGYSRSAYPPSVHLRMGEKELNFAVDDLLVSLLLCLSITVLDRCRLVIGLMLGCG